MRTLGDDRVIASVRAARDAYAALHGHDVGAIFENIRSAQESSGRVYERLVQGTTPLAMQVTEAIRQAERSLGPVLDRLDEWSIAAAPFFEKVNRIAAAAAEAMERFRPHVEAIIDWHRIVDTLDAVGWLPYRSVPFHYVEECGEDPRSVEQSPR